MPPWPEIRHYFDGALKLAKGDPGGMRHFDLSIEGFWRSFWAVAIVAPGYALIVADQYARSTRPVAGIPTLVGEAAGYLLDWAVFPLVALVLVRFFGLGRRYVPLIVAHNWSALVQIALLVAIVLLGALVPDEIRRMLLMMAMGAVLFYRGFVIKTALESNVGTAFGFLAADLVATILVRTMVELAIRGS